MPIMAATMRDSSAVQGNVVALNRRFDEDGYLLLRGACDRSAVDGVRRAVLTVLGRHGWLASRSDRDAALPGRVVHHEDDDHGWWDAYRDIQSLESFHALAHHPDLLRIAGMLVAGEVLVHPRKIARVTFPASGFPTPAHQDHPLLQGTADVYTMWLPLASCGSELGALRILRGSHAQGLCPPVLREGVGGVGVDVADDDARYVSTEYEPGDVLVFHSLTVHQAPPNRGEQLRLSVDYRYQARGEAIVDMSLRPHGYPKCPDWDVLTAGWASRDTVLPHHAGLALTAFHDPFGLEAAPSRRRGMAGAG